MCLVSKQHRVQVALSQIMEHLGLDSFLEVSVKSQPDEEFKKGNFSVAMLKERYATEGGEVPPPKSWCLTLGALDSLQVSYQPRPNDAQLQCPCIPLECSGVDEAMKEHMGRASVQGAVDEMVAEAQADGSKACMLALNATAAPLSPSAIVLDQVSATQNYIDVHNTVEENKSSHACDQIQAGKLQGGAFSQVWKEVTKPCVPGVESQGAEVSCVEDEQPSVEAVLASVDAAASQHGGTESVCVEGDVLAGTVQMDADTLAASAAAGLDKQQCRMM